MADEKKFLSEFIEEYRKLPSLWKVKSKEYSNRVLKNNAYAILIEKLKEKDPVADRELVVKQINKLRTNYRRELKKVKMSEKSGAGAEDIYIPTLWYFPLLSFLKDQEESVESCNTMDESLMIQNSEPPAKKKKTSPEDNLIMLAAQTLENACNNKEDSVAQSWASQYNQLGDRQQILARKMVSDILFHASLGNLEVHHSVQLQNIFNPPVKTLKISSMPSSQQNSTYHKPPSQSFINRIRDPNHLSSNRPIVSNRVSTPISPYTTPAPNFVNKIMTVPVPKTSDESYLSYYSEYDENASLALESSENSIQSNENTEIQSYFQNFGTNMNF